MLPLTEITQETLSQQLTQEFLERMLTEASDRSSLKFIEFLNAANEEGSESHAGADSLKLSPKTKEELTGFFKKIAENVDKLFFKDCQTDDFQTLFYKEIELAKNRLESGGDLRPEQRLELQPSAYSGFDDKFSQQDFANILFVMAMANYASNKSQGKIEEDKIIGVLKSMDAKSANQQEKLSREPFIQYSDVLSLSTGVLNATVTVIQAVSIALLVSQMDKKINWAIRTRDKLLELNDPNATLSGNNFTHNQSAIIRQNYIDSLALDLDNYNVTKTDIDDMLKHRKEKTIVPALALAESASRMIADIFFRDRHNANTKFLLFATSLLFASESLAEIISNKNLVKTFLNLDEPTSVDNRLLVDSLRIGLLFASQFDSRFRIDRVANNIIRSLSSLCLGVVNCAENLFKSTEIDLESGPLIENTISPDQIKELAKEFTKLLAISTPTPPPELRASTSTPPPELRASTPPSEVRVSSSASAGGKQPTTSTI